MAGVTQLGYLGIGVSDVDAWTSYARDLLGVDVAAKDGGDTVLFRLDEHHHRIAVHGSGEDDVLYAGWQVDDAAALAEVATRLEASGTTVTAGSADLREQRRVQDLIVFDDPDGHRTEVFYGPEMGSAGADGRFVAGDQGLGHFVLAASDLQRAMTFYTEVLGMKVSDYVNMGRVNMGFLHCNPRHHSLAFVELPQTRKRINHFMLQLRDGDDVGRAWDKVQDGKAPVIMTLGKHANDHMTSFYMANPSRFGVEYGFGAREIDDSCWEIGQYDSGSIWGHRRPAPPSEARR